MRLRQPWQDTPPLPKREDDEGSVTPPLHVANPDEESVTPPLEDAEDPEELEAGKK